MSGPFWVGMHGGGFMHGLAFAGQVEVTAFVYPDHKVEKAKRAQDIAPSPNIFSTDSSCGLLWPRLRDEVSQEH